MGVVGEGGGGVGCEGEGGRGQGKGARRGCALGLVQRRLAARRPRRRRCRHRHQHRHQHRRRRRPPNTADIAAPTPNVMRCNTQLSGRAKGSEAAASAGRGGLAPKRTRLGTSLSHLGARPQRSLAAAVSLSQRAAERKPHGGGGAGGDGVAGCARRGWPKRVGYRK